MLSTPRMVLVKTLSAGHLVQANHSVGALQMRHPLALAHYANHPPRDMQPNVMVAAVDVQLEGEQASAYGRAAA